MSSRLTKRAKETLESIKHVNENGNEFWTARDLYKVLEYTEYRNFLPVARKAWTACQQSGFNPYDHFVPFNDMVKIGSGAERQVDNIKMSRYGAKVRKAIKEIGGTMPEDLPVAESIKILERKEKKLKKIIGKIKEEDEQ